MKSQRRHDLQENSLIEEIQRLGAFIKANSSRILTVVLLVLVVVTAFAMWRRRSRSAEVQIITRYEQAKMDLQQALFAPEQAEGVDDLRVTLRELGAQSRVAWIAADAQLGLGQLALAEAVQAESDEARAQALTTAEAAFRTVVDTNASSLPGLAGLGQIGMARVAEARGEYDVAKTIYEAVAQNDAMKGYPAAQLARQDAARVAGYQGQVQLAAYLPAWANPTPATKPAEDGDDVSNTEQVPAASDEPAQGAQTSENETK